MGPCVALHRLSAVPLWSVGSQPGMSSGGSIPSALSGFTHESSMKVSETSDTTEDAPLGGKSLSGSWLQMATPGAPLPQSKGGIGHHQHITAAAASAAAMDAEMDPNEIYTINTEKYLTMGGRRASTPTAVTHQPPHSGVTDSAVGHQTDHPLQKQDQGDVLEDRHSGVTDSAVAWRTTDASRSRATPRSRGSTPGIRRPSTSTVSRTAETPSLKSAGEEVLYPTQHPSDPVTAARAASPPQGGRPPFSRGNSRDFFRDP